MSDDKKTAAPEKKQEKAETLSGQTLEQVLKMVAEQLIPSAVASAIAATQASRPQAAAAPPAPLGNVRCNECKQHPNACKGAHTKMVVFPTRYPQHADYFQGVIINGVRYLSNDDSHLVTVPTASVSDILNTVAGYEINEQEMSTGRIAERHSGRASPHGTSFNPQSAAWR